MVKVMPWLAGAALLFSVPASAQNFLLNSAETINRGNFKVGAYPMVLFGEHSAAEGDQSRGIAGRLGYGLTRSFDLEAKAAFFDDFKLYGGDGEYWLVKGRTDVSVAAGFHLIDAKGAGDAKAFDASLLVSRNLADRFEPYLGLSVCLESLDGVPGRDFKRLHVVPGFEFRLQRDLDFVAELAIGLNDDSANLLAFGLAYYIR